MSISTEGVRYIFDTDTVTHQQLGRTRVIARLAFFAADEVATTVITLEEQSQGRLAVIRRQRETCGLASAYRLLGATHAYFCERIVLPFDESAQAIYRELLARRVRIGTQDLHIAAIVLARDATLVTSNQRDFLQVPGLRIEDWNS